MKGNYSVTVIAAATPVTYIVINHIKRLEGEFLAIPGNSYEHFDEGVSYNPFRF